MGEWVNGRLGDWEIGRLCSKMSCVFASLREGGFARERVGEGVILKLQITNYGELGEATGRGSDGTTGRKGEWVILKLRITERRAWRSDLAILHQDWQ